MAIRKKKAKKSKVDEVASEIVEIVAGNKKDKAKKTEKSKAKSKKSKEKAKSKKAKSKKAFTTKEIKSTWKELSLPSIITTKEVVIMVEKMTGYRLGTDLTAGAKNLRRYLRTLDRYNDGEITYYRWSIKDDEDLSELADIMEYYNNKKAKIG